MPIVINANMRGMLYRVDPTNNCATVELVANNPQTAAATDSQVISQSSSFFLL